MDLNPLYLYVTLSKRESYSQLQLAAEFAQVWIHILSVFVGHFPSILQKKAVTLSGDNFIVQQTNQNSVLESHIDVCHTNCTVLSFVSAL